MILPVFLCQYTVKNSFAVFHCRMAVGCHVIFTLVMALKSVIRCCPAGCWR
ncbi:hypothetical protein ACNKHO_07540 [Shigella flexneri]